MTLPSWTILDPLVEAWLVEDIGRGDRTTIGIAPKLNTNGKGTWVCKQSGILAGLPIASRVFHLLDKQVQFIPDIEEGQWGDRDQVAAHLSGPIGSLLTGERVALNIVMRLSGIATMTRQYVDLIEDLPVQLVDTRKTTPGLRILEKYASWVGGAHNHRMGLDDGIMIKDNHIAVSGGIDQAINCIRQRAPYPLSIEVETTTLEQVQTALTHGADIIMLDNMAIEHMQAAVVMIRDHNAKTRIEASGNITLERLRAVAETGVDYISTSAPITRSPWLDISMRLG